MYKLYIIMYILTNDINKYILLFIFVPPITAGSII